MREDVGLNIKGGLGRDAAKLVSLRRASKGIGTVARENGLAETGYLDKRRRKMFFAISRKIS